MDIVSIESQSQSQSLSLESDNSTVNSSGFLIENITLPTSEIDPFVQAAQIMIPLQGSVEADFLLATAADDLVFGLAGNDTIFGLEGNDLIQGNQGNDELFGNQGNDRLYAGKGDDTIAGGKANDILFGDLGSDVLFGNLGSDELLGHGDNDILYGGQDNDLGAGGAGDDQLFGDLGDDTLLGDRGADTITSGSGNDLIFIGDGTGGATLVAADVIVDFEIGSDVLGLLNLLKPSELSLTQGTGNLANDTIIQRRDTGEFLAILQNVEANRLTMDQFQFQGMDGGTPEPTPTPTPGPEPTPTPTPIPTPTPTPVPTPGIIEFSLANVSVEEDAGQVQFIVNRIGGSDGAISVNYATQEGTATPGSDYVPVNTTVNFASGELSKTVSVNLIDDTLVETDETFNLVLSNPTRGAALGAATTTATILDNDTIQIALGQTTFSAQEGIPAAEITVIRQGDTTGAVGATLTQTSGTATAPADYSNGAIAVNFAPGETTQILQIPIVDDSLLESTEFVTVNLTNPTGGAILGPQSSGILNIADNEPSSNLSLTTATYLGTAANDTAAAVKISPVDKALVVAGNFNNTGEIRRLVNGNTAPLSTTGLGGEVRDLDIDRENGNIATVGTFGVRVLNSTAAATNWSQPGTFDDVAIANDGTVVTLTESTDRITRWSATGTELGSFTLTGGDVRPADIAIHPTTGAVIITGFTQATSTLQIPFVRAFDASFNSTWETWGFSASAVTGQNLGADSRGVQITFGADGELYFLGRTDGGNNVFQRDGNNITQPLATNVEVDQFNNFSGAGSGSFTFHARLDAATGKIEQGQFIVTRLTNGNANSFSPNSITADEVGNIYIGGSSAASIENRGGRTINGQPVGNYTLGEMAVLTLTPDYQVRRIWTPLTASSDGDGSKGRVDSFAVGNGQAVIFGTVEQPNVATVPGALNPNPLGGTDAYLATWSV